MGHKTVAILGTCALLLVAAGCSEKNNIELLSKKYEECVSNAEMKHALAVDAMCSANLDYAGSTKCHFPIAQKETLDRSKDNEINACAQMYSPKK